MASRLWRFAMRRDQHWARRGIPFVPSKPIVGSLQLFNAKPQHEVDLERHRKYGRIYGTFEGKQPVLVLSDPDLLEQILISNFPVFTNRRAFYSGYPDFDCMLGVATGEKWKRIRDVISPAFQEKNNLLKISPFWECASEKVVGDFADSAGKSIDGKKLFTTYALDVIALSAFNLELQDVKHLDEIFIRYAKMIFPQKRTWRLSMWLFFPGMAKKLEVCPFSSKGMAFFRKIVAKAYNTRIMLGIVKDDFLQLLMDSESRYESRLSQAKVGGSGLKRYLTVDEVVAQCISFVAGYDTTATALACASYLLALHPDIQEKAREEVDAIIKDYGGKITYEAILRMDYLQRILDETLRMYPTITRIERVAGRDFELGETGIIIAKDSVVTIPLYAMHRDHDLFPEPEKFDPERFSAEEKRKRHQCAYLPYGTGPRNCLGDRFANFQMKYCMSYMLSQLVIKRCPETKVPLEMTSPQNILQMEKVMFVVEKRKNPSLDLDH